MRQASTQTTAVEICLSGYTVDTYRTARSVRCAVPLDRRLVESGMPISVAVKSYMSSYTGAMSKQCPGTDLGTTADLEIRMERASQEQ
jgi:hypothetical protein